MEESTLRQLQMVQLEILLEVKRICKKYNLQYFLIGGTLLGAVRHKGFIPWDDDLDIGMPRWDFDEFIKYCSKDFLNRKYYLHSNETDPEYWLPFAKLRKNGTFYNEESIVTIDTHKGIYIDIFPLDNVASPNSRFMRIQSKMVRYLLLLIHNKRGLRLNFAPKKKHKILFMLAKPFSIRTLARLQRKIMILKNNRNTAYWVSFGSHYSPIKETMPKDKYLPSRELEFEGELFSVPSDCNYSLTRLFGDYMTLPPLEQRSGHHSIEVQF